MSLWQTSVTDWNAQANDLRRGRCGMVEIVEQRLTRVVLRPMARRASRVEVRLWGPIAHRWRPGNRCWLYYRQPRRFPQFLVLDYVVSTRAATLATFRGALGVLDEIARLKGSDALLCDVASTRISDRLLSRWGWAPHAQGRGHRHFIKRFYGTYPARDELANPVLAGLVREPGVPQLTLCC